jgi:hypothetical protein
LRVGKCPNLQPQVPVLMLGFLQSFEIIWCCVCIEKINGQFWFKEGGTPAEYSAWLKFAIDQGWLLKHESARM